MQPPSAAAAIKTAATCHCAATSSRVSASPASMTPIAVTRAHRAATPRCTAAWAVAVTSTAVPTRRACAAHASAPRAAAKGRTRRTVQPARRRATKPLRSACSATRIRIAGRSATMVRIAIIRAVAACTASTMDNAPPLDRAAIEFRSAAASVDKRAIAIWDPCATSARSPACERVNRSWPRDHSRK